MNKYIRIVDLPITVNGMTVRDENGDYNIYINKNLGFHAQIDALMHEENHICDEDFEALVSVLNLEDK